MVVMAESLGEVGPDAIAVEHAADLLLERHHHGERRLGEDLARRAAHDREVVETRAAAARRTTRR